MENVNPIPPVIGWPLWLKIVIGIVLAVALVAASASVAYYLFKVNGAADSNQANKVVNANTDTLPEGDQFAWQAPKQIEKLDVFSAEAKVIAEYYLVGKVLSGKYQDGEIILAFNNTGMVSALDRLIKKDNQIFLLERLSDDKEDQAGSEFLLFDKEKVIFDKDYQIASLNYPDTLNGPQGQVLEKVSTGPYFFNFNNLTKSFTDAAWGDVFTTKDKLSDYSSPTGRFGFYLQAPDGTLVVYKLKVNFVSKESVPQVTWLDGLVNKDVYSFQDQTGCGSSNYASVVSEGEINLNTDLKVVGKNSQKEDIYELQDDNSQILKDLYANKYRPLDGEPKMSYSEFILSHPMFFWKDPFGRLIKFESYRFQPMAECGKPVIYLYPEQETEVSVKLYPQGGFSYTEPAYGNGWLVKARPDGKITNLADNRNYPYLFWEGRGGIYQTPASGFVVEKEKIESFLKEKLAKQGLNQKETDDFMEFWLPKMQSSPYYFITFLDNRAMDLIAPLDISPKPDTVIRILMDFLPLEKPIQVKPLEIRTPIRNGFTVVEWGGVLR